MKIKKALALIMTAALTVGTMAGCSQTTLDYSKELSNTAKWEAVTSQTTGTVSVDAQKVKEDISFTCTAYKANDNEYADMKFTDPKGVINIPEIKVYSDGTTSYINKSFYEGIYTLTGQVIPEGLAKISEEYIGIDATSNQIAVEQIKALTNDPDALVKLGKLLFGDSDIDLPFVKNGREYTINLDEDKTVDLSAKAIKAAGNNIDNINKTFKLGLTTDVITQIKTEVNGASLGAANLNWVKAALVGSTITSKEVFTDSNYTSDFNMNLQIKDFGKVSFLMKSTCTKSEVKAIVLPTSKIKLTAEEFAKISAPTNTTIPATTNVVAK